MLRYAGCWILCGVGASLAKAQAPDGLPASVFTDTLTAAHFTAACALLPSGPDRDLACTDSVVSPATAEAFLDRLPERGDRGMPNAWSALAVARAEMFAASDGAWSDSGWNRPVRLHRRPAITALRRAITLQPGFLPALAIFETLSPYPHLWDAPQHELAQFRAVPAEQLPSVLWVPRVFLELETGHDTAAQAVLDSLRAQHADAPVILYLSAVVDADVGNAPVAVTWATYRRFLEHSSGANATAWADYDALWVAEPDERTELRATGADDRPQWLRQFWEGRDQQTGAAPGTRWVTQQRRYLAALREYRAWPAGGVEMEHQPVAMMILPPTMVSDSNKAFEAGDPHRLPRGVDWYEPPPPNGNALVTRRVFDDRGAVFIRHGPPLRSVEWLTELWDAAGALADDPTGNPVVRARSDSEVSLPFLRIPHLWYALWLYGNDERASALSFGQMTTASPAMWAFDFPRGGDLMTPCGIDSRFCRAMKAPGVRQLLRTFGHESLVHEMVTDDAEPRVRRTAGVITETYGLLGGGVLVVYAVPLDSLSVKSAHPIRDVRGADAATRDTLHLAVSLARPGEGIVTYIDTTRIWTVPSNGARGRFASGYALLAAPPGAADVTLSVFSPDSTIGDIRQHRGIAIPDFARDTPVIGPPILGREHAGLRFTRNGVVIPLNPTNAWRSNEPVTVYYEAQGLMTGRSYETRIELYNTSAKKSEPDVTVSSVARATQASIAVQRVVGLTQLGPGRYRLVIRLRDTTSGVSVSSEGYVTVVK